MKMLRGEPIKRRRLYEDVAKRLAKAIMDGEIKAGEALPSEREIMDAFGVGRTAVREALFALQTDGLVRLSSGRRPIVVEPIGTIMEKLASPARFMLTEPDRLRQLQEARTMLESFLARQAAGSASPQQITAIERALKKNRAAIDDPTEFVRTNIDFHFQIAHSAENVFVDALHVALSHWLEEHRKVAIQRNGAAKQALKRHEEIFDAIRQHDKDAAENAMRVHLNESQENYWTVINGNIDKSFVD